ncbi:MAG: metalloregulator ArsR/SmtB family transcription factor [Pseudomonadota bacterium]
MTDVFKALAHPARREILSILSKGAASAGDLADQFSIAKPTLSGHLNILKEAQLVDAERRGTTLIYRINASVAEEALSGFMSILGVGETAPARATRPSKGRAK